MSSYSTWRASHRKCGKSASTAVLVETDRRLYPRPVIEILEGSLELLPALNDLFVERFGHELEEAEWRWKYDHVPGRSLSLVGMGPEGRVLAHAGAIGLEADWPGGRAKAFHLLQPTIQGEHHSAPTLSGCRHSNAAEPYTQHQAP